MDKFLERIDSLIWGVPLLVLILGCGIYLSFATGFVQLRLFPKALKSFCGQIRVNRNENGISGYQALCTALSATVGTGNIVGVAGAIALGGPGAIFWMWMFAFLGMAVKFAEATLAVYYRVSRNGLHEGGPMYMIEIGLGKQWKPMALIYSFFGVIAAFGVGNATQINAAVSGVNSVIMTLGGAVTDASNLMLGIIFAVFIGISVSGGAKRIGKIAQSLIPFACLAYVVLCCTAIIMQREALTNAVMSIFRGAFQPKSVTAGILGSAFVALRVGASRGLFTNEAGMGTAAMAHGTADVLMPTQQGLMGIIEVFLDTIVICTLTALVILTSGVPIPYNTDPGLLLTVQAFAAVFGDWIQILLAFFLALFAIATVLGWGLYGGVCAKYLMGEKAQKKMLWIQIFVIVFSSISGTQTVWLLSEAVNGLMAIPNLIMLTLLTPKLKCLLSEQRKNLLRI